MPKHLPHAPMAPACAPSHLVKLYYLIFHNTRQTITPSIVQKYAKVPSLSRAFRLEYVGRKMFV